LNEVFADYFINEFDDPLNAYTGGMANYAAAPTLMNLGGSNNSASAGGVATMGGHSQPAQAPGSVATNQTSSSLPTGGIRTTFHTGVAPAPAAKKPKTSNGNDLQLADPTPLSVLASRPAIVGISSSNQQSNMGTAQNQQQVQGQAQVQLPVGVGIRLGGLGGVAPQASLQGQQQQQQQPGVTLVPGSQYSGNIDHNVWSAPGAKHNGAFQGDGIMMDDHNNGGGTVQQIAERRQRNREHAKRSRVRKKFMLESLQEQVRGLQNENNRLRMLVQEHIPEHAMQIIAECCTKNHLFEDATNSLSSESAKPAAGSSTESKNGELVRSDYSLMQSLMSGQKCFVLSDPTLPDNPIVFATPDFYKLTGYTSKEVLGRNCRFLQGPGTDKKAVEVIRRAIATGSDATVCLLNYKSDGTPFWNQFFIGALRDADNNIVNFVSGLLLLLLW